MRLLMRRHAIQARGKRKFRVYGRSPLCPQEAAPDRPSPAHRGSQYASEDFGEVMKLYGLIPSMSRKANCWDNAVTETLFGSLKVERLHGETFFSVRAAKDAVIGWILWYNQKRMHSTIGYQSPVEFEQAWQREKVKAAA